MQDSNIGNSSNLIVQDVCVILIPFVDDALNEVDNFTTHFLVCRLYGFWHRLENLNKWISKQWNPLLKGETCVFYYVIGLFVLDFDEIADRECILNSSPWL